MPDHLNQINCPHCAKTIDISLFAKGELAQKLEIEIEKKLNDQIDQKVTEQSQRIIEASRVDLKKNIELEYKSRVDLLNEEVRENLTLISDLELSKAKLEIEKLKNKNELNKIQEDRSLAVSIAVTEALRTEKANNDNVVSEKDLTIISLKNSIAELERQSRQGSQQMQGEAGEILIEKILEREFPGDNVEEIRKGQAGADSVLKVRSPSGLISGSIYFEAKRTREFSRPWIEKLKRDVARQNASIGVLVTETMPADKKRPHLIDGIWICHFSDFVTVSKILRQGLISIAKIRNAELVRTDRAQIMFDYLISKRFADTMSAMLSPIFKMSEQLQKERTAITRQWAIREKMIDEVISNANIFHGHLVSASDNGMPPIEGLATIAELDQLN